MIKDVWKSFHIVHSCWSFASQQIGGEDVVDAYSKYVESGEYPKALDNLNRYHDPIFKHQVMETPTKISCSKTPSNSDGM